MHTSQLLDQILNDFFESKNHTLNNLYNRKYQHLPLSDYMSAIKMLFAANLLEYEVSKSNTPIDEWATLVINLNGRDVIKEGGYEKVQASRIAKHEEKENLEMQQLRTNVLNLTNQVADYEWFKKIAKWGLIIAAFSAILALIALVK